MRLDRYDQGGYAGGGITENGGNISGPLVLAGNPSQTLEAVPKQYVDAYFNSLNASNLTAGTLAAARLPNFTGDLQSVAGTSQLTLANSSVVAGEHAKVTVNSKGIITGGGNITNDDIPFGLPWNKINPASLPSTLSGYGVTNGINISGGTLTGFLSVANQPTLGSHVATKQYVDALVSGGGIAVGDIIRKPYSITPAGFLKCNGGEVSKTTYSALYAIIGDQYIQNTVPGNGKPWQQQYQINTTQSTDITSWTTATSLPIAISATQALVTKNRVYLLGGKAGISTVISTVYTAPINSDGTLGAWTSDTSLPNVLMGTQVITTKNRVYLLGGHNGTNAVATVYTAPINVDGTLGAWSTGTSLPAALNGSQAIITKNRVYLLGGANSAGTPVSTVYTASVAMDGTLGPWTTGTNLPSALYGSTAVVTKNRVYMCCGTSDNLNVSGYTSAVYTAAINPDGTLGTWSVSSSVPEALYASQAIVTKNKAYLLGGNTGAADTKNVYAANINSDGTLGAWSLMPTVLLGGVHWSQSIMVANKVYLFGAWNANSGSSTVYTATISGGLNDYSSYYDGTIIPVEPVNSSTKFTLPDLTTDDPFGSYSYIKY